jgi:hypothetical protein
MELKEIIEKVTDPYERNARLYPALLALFPLIAMVIGLYGPKASTLSNILITAGSCGGLFLVTNLGRESGKRLEPKLFGEWGGKPTTQLLRHRDGRIEGVTKERYHAFLSGKIKKPFPTRDEEAHDPGAADDIYQSGVRWLLNQTRDTKKFGLLFKENITYGFRRNALGLKPIGWPLSICCVLWVLTTHGVFKLSADHFCDKTALMGLPETAIASLTASMFMFAAWTLFFTKSSTRTAAFTYAETLLRTCDVL